MQCPYCGGWHGGVNPPPITHHIDSPTTPDSAKDMIDKAMQAGYSKVPDEPDPYEEDTLPEGKPNLWGPRVYGTDEGGREVTVVFGAEGGSKENNALISDGHITGWEFYVKDGDGVKGHDHIGPGPSPDQLRDRYSGWEDFHDHIEPEWEQS